MHLYRRRPEERLRTGEEWSNAIAIYAEPSDGRVLAELRLMAGDDDEPRKDVLFYISELRTEWNPPAM